MQGTSEVSEAIELIANKFEDMLKNEIVNIVARKLSKSVARAMNTNVLESGNRIDMGDGIFYNTSLTRDPLI